MIRISRGFSGAEALVAPVLSYGTKAAVIPQSVTSGYGYVMQAADAAYAMTNGDAKAKQDAAVAAAMTAMTLIPGAAPAMPFVAAMFGVTALLQKAFPAHGVISAAVVEGSMFDGPAGEYPLVGVWKQAVAAVQVAWDAVRQAQGIPPSTAVAIRSGLLRPVSPAERAPTDLLSSLIGGLTSSESVIQGADQCLLHWLNSYVKGWKTTKGCQQDLGSGRWAWVWNTEIEGTVEMGGASPPGADPNVWAGMGPFGVKTDNWPLDLNPNTQKQLAECISDVWRYRLEALTKAVPEVIGAAVVQAMDDAKAGPVKLSATTRLTLPTLAKAAAPVVPKSSASRLKTIVPVKPAAVAPNALVTWAKGLPQVTWIAVGAALLIAVVGGGIWYVRRIS